MVRKVGEPHESVVSLFYSLPKDLRPIEVSCSVLKATRFGQATAIAPYPVTELLPKGKFLRRPKLPEKLKEQISAIAKKHGVSASISQHTSRGKRLLLVSAQIKPNDFGDKHIISHDDLTLFVGADSPCAGLELSGEVPKMFDVASAYKEIVFMLRAHRA